MKKQRVIELAVKDGDWDNELYGTRPDLALTAENH